MTLNTRLNSHELLRTNLAAIESNSSVGEDQATQVQGLLADLSGLPSAVAHPAIDEQLRVMQQSIERTQLTMQKMRTLRNSSVPVHCLPAELLEEIIWLSTGPDLPNAGDYDVSDGVISMTHVCRHWRAVALHNAKLWTNITVKSPLFKDKPRVCAFLRRSKSFPLNVIILSLLNSSVSNCILTLRPHMHRVQRMCIRTPSAVVMHSVLKRLKTAAPRLQEMTLHHRTTMTDFVIPPETPDELSIIWPFRSRVLFDGQTPALRTLHLSSVSLPLPCAILQNLRELTFDDQPSQLIRATGILDVLERCPNLEILTVRSSAPTGPAPVAFDHNRTVRLTALRELTLAGQTMSFVQVVLSRLALPGPTRISIRSYGWRHTSSILRIMPRSCTLIHTLSSLHTLSAFALDDDRVVFQGYNHHADTPALTAEPALELELNGDPGASLSCIGRALPLDALETLVVGDPHLTMPQSLWARLFVTTPRLRTLQLAELARPSLSSCLLALAGHPSSANGMPVLPHLTDLEVIGGTFDASLSRALECAVQYLSVQGELGRVELVGVQNPTVDKEGLGYLCDVEVNEVE